MEKQIAIVEREDLGPVLARADHQANTVELNGKVFYGLPPMVQEFILCHEVCHLTHHEWDEEKTNALAAKLFLSRASDDDDREARRKFLSYMDGNGEYSNSLTVAGILGIATSALSLGLNLYGKIKSANQGWYSWDRTTQRDNLRVMLTQAFEQSRRSSQQSAADFFWAQLQQYDFKDSDLSKFLSRSENNWVKAEIRAFENDYGFGFEEVTEIDITAFPLLIAAIGVVIGIAIYYIIKNASK